MRDAATVLAIIHERGRQGLPLEDIYRQLYNPSLYIRAYERLRHNHGALTPGATGETVDGMSLKKIGRIIETVRLERYRWTPARRIYIPKKNGKVRPLGMPCWSDKLLGEVMRSILEAYYDPQFSTHSHGFRPGRGCHTALATVKRGWTGTKWFIEGDISQCFDQLDHGVLMAILAERLHDNRFLRLIQQMLTAGYLEHWTWHATHSGSPQGSVVSPILSNVYLDRLDRYGEEILIPQTNRGDKRRTHPLWKRAGGALRRARKKGDRDAAKRIAQQRRAFPSVDPDDPDFRRLTYVRYADDFLLGFIGPKAEAQVIKEQLRAFLHDTLKLELSEQKTLVTHATTEVARFLGYEIKAYHADTKCGRDGRRNVNGKIGLMVPMTTIAAKRAQYMAKEHPIHRPELFMESDYSIMMRYQQEYRGMVQYYLPAQNVGCLNHLHHTMFVSLVKTLAGKHKTKCTAILRKYIAHTQTDHGPRKCLRVTVPRAEGKPPLVATFGGLSLRRQEGALLEDSLRDLRFVSNHTDGVQRLLADTCELCGMQGDCEVHHIRKLADLHRKDRREKPEWMQRMIALRRKTLVVCPACHNDIHYGRPLNHARERILESRVR
ncbi:MAG TPA: reverse transcriptase domain-containing protein [Chloroflexota bacterium]|nr:reverse transcriptase domain-containing protein [Chloroflexota bacterium]